MSFTLQQKKKKKCVEEMQQADFTSGTVIKLTIPVSVQTCTHETELWECNYLKKVSLRVQRDTWLKPWNHDLIYSIILHKKNQTFENTEEYYSEALRAALMARVKWM